MAFVAGHLASTTVWFGVVSLMGGALNNTIDRHMRRSLLVAVIALSLALDMIGLATRTLCAVSFRRQSPRRTDFDRGTASVALRWGIDTGIPLSTYRVTGFYLILLTATMFGITPWWSGIVYSLAFTIPITAAVYGRSPVFESTNLAQKYPTVRASAIALGSILVLSWMVGAI